MLLGKNARGFGIPVSIHCNLPVGIAFTRSFCRTEQSASRNNIAWIKEAISQNDKLDASSQIARFRWSLR